MCSKHLFGCVIERFGYVSWRFVRMGSRDLLGCVMGIYGDG